MQTLNDIPRVAKSLKTGSTGHIKLLHKFIFGSDEGRQNRARLRAFTGFTAEDLNNKTKFYDGFSLKELISICNLLKIEFSTEIESCREAIFEALSDFSILNSENSDVDEDDGVIHDVEQNLPDPFLSSLPVNTTPHITSVNPSQSCDRELDQPQSNPGSLIVPQSSHFSLRDLSDLVRPFSGKDDMTVENYICEVEEVFELHHICDPVYQLIFAKRCLRGPALTLIRAIRGINTFDRLKWHLRDEFGEQLNSFQLHTLLNSRRLTSNETLQEYFLAMREIAQKGSPGQVDDSSLIEYVIKGIPPSNNKLILYGAKTLREFKEKLKVYEKLCTASQSTGRNFSGQYARDFVDNRYFPNFPVCYSCGMKGHKSDRCPNRERSKRCYGCKEFGHVQTNCPHKPRHWNNDGQGRNNNDSQATPCQYVASTEKKDEEEESKPENGVSEEKEVEKEEPVVEEKKNGHDEEKKEHKEMETETAADAEDGAAKRKVDETKEPEAKESPVKKTKPAENSESEEEEKPRKKARLSKEDADDLEDDDVDYDYPDDENEDRDPDDDDCIPDPEKLPSFEERRMMTQIMNWNQRTRPPEI